MELAQGVEQMVYLILKRNKQELCGISPQANYTDRSTAALRRS
jgi:hypothetical protein